MTSASPIPQAPASTSRAGGLDLAFDILKGISILEVVTHHVLAFSLQKHPSPGAWDWWMLAAANRILHFAVPTFLLVSALLLGRSLAARPRPDWRRFYQRRALRTLLPYVIWTLLYLAFRLWVVRADTDVARVEASVPLFGSVHIPQFLTWDRLLPAIVACVTWAASAALMLPRWSRSLLFGR